MRRLSKYFEPAFFHALNSVEAVQHSKNVEITLLKAPKDAGYYVFSGKKGLVIAKEHNNFKPDEILKSFSVYT